MNRQQRRRNMHGKGDPRNAVKRKRRQVRTALRSQRAHQAFQQFAHEVVG